MLRIEGQREITAALEAMDRKAQRSVPTKAARQTLKPVLQRARAAAKAGKHATGDLAEALTIKTWRDGQEILAAVVAGKKRRSKRQLAKIAAGKRRVRKRYKPEYFGAFADAYYAHMVEYGHKPGGWHADQAGAADVPAHPILGPAWDTAGDEQLNRQFADDLWKQIERVWEKT